MYDCIKSVTNADSIIMGDKKSTEALNITVVPINSLDFEVGEDDTADADSVTSIIENEEPVDEDESLEVPIADHVVDEDESQEVPIAVIRKGLLNEL